MKIIRLIIATVLFCASLNGCSVQDQVSSSLASVTTTAVTIDTSFRASQAFGSVLQARDYVITTSELYKNLGEFSFNVMATDPALASANTDIPCTDGGTYKYTGTVASGAYNLTLTFAGCRQNRFQSEGSYTVTGGTPTKIIVKLGSSSSTFNIFYFDKAYSTLIAYLKAAVTVTLSGSGTATNANYTITPLGSITTFDYMLLTSFNMSYSNAKLTYSLTTDPVTGDRTTSITANGNFAEASTTMGVTISATGFRVDRTEQYNSGSGSFTGSDVGLSGELKFNFSPNNYCLEGTYTVSTATPVHTNYALGYTTQGTLTLNGVAFAQYNAAGDIDVSVTGDAPLNFAKEYLLMQVCDFSALEVFTPPYVGTTGTASGTTMDVTLTWYGGATSDMDLHLKYYATTTPDALTAETWHMDWHQGKSYPGSSNSCSDPTGLSFGDAFDLDGTHGGTCDVGLDFDDTQGYGPEHITALKIPAGYYVVSVNSYSLDADPSATMYLAIHVGDSLFGPYTSTFTTSGGEGTDPATWFRVADVLVDGSGTVQVLAPNAALTPWH